MSKSADRDRPGVTAEAGPAPVEAQARPAGWVWCAACHAERPTERSPRGKLICSKCRTFVKDADANQYRKAIDVQEGRVEVRLATLRRRHPQADLDLLRELARTEVWLRGLRPGERRRKWMLDELSALRAMLHEEQERDDQQRRDAGADLSPDLSGLTDEQLAQHFELAARDLRERGRERHALDVARQHLPEIQQRQRAGEVLTLAETHALSEAGLGVTSAAPATGGAAIVEVAEVPAPVPVPARTTCEYCGLPYSRCRDLRHHMRTRRSDTTDAEDELAGFTVAEVRRWLTSHEALDEDWRAERRTAEMFKQIWKPI